MADLSAWFERLKSNKYALPALAVGAIAGGYVLLKKGGLSGGTPSTSPAVTPDPNAGTGGGGGTTTGGTDTSGQTDAAITALQQQQQSFQQSLVDQFNSLVSSVQNSLSGQQQQTQQALNSLASQQQAVQTQAQAPLSMPSLPDFSALYAAIASIPSQVQAAAQSPGFKLGGGAYSVSVPVSLKPAARVTSFSRPGSYSPLPAITGTAAGRAGGLYFSPKLTAH